LARILSAVAWLALCLCPGLGGGEAVHVADGLLAGLAFETGPGLAVVVHGETGRFGRDNESGKRIAR